MVPIQTGLRGRDSLLSVLTLIHESRSAELTLFRILHTRLWKVPDIKSQQIRNVETKKKLWSRFKRPQFSKPSPRRPERSEQRQRDQRAQTESFRETHALTTCQRENSFLTYSVWRREEAATQEIEKTKDTDAETSSSILQVRRNLIHRVWYHGSKVRVQCESTTVHLTLTRTLLHVTNNTGN